MRGRVWVALAATAVGVACGGSNNDVTFGSGGQGGSSAAGGATGGTGGATGGTGGATGGTGGATGGTGGATGGTGGTGGTVGGADCASPIGVSLAPGTIKLAGSTVGGGSHESTSGNCAASGPDRIYAIKPTVAGFVTASLPRTTTPFDSVLWVATSCGDVNELLCADSYDPATNQGLDGGEVLSFLAQAGQTYYLMVDGFDSTQSGSYSLVLDLSSGRECSDPVPITLWPGSAMTVLGSTTGDTPSFQGTCGGNPGGETIYAITREPAGSVQVDTDANYTNYNSVLYARPGCGTTTTELACSNQNGTAMESITLSSVGNTPVFVWVDGSQQGGGGASGDYGLTLTP